MVLLKRGLSPLIKDFLLFQDEISYPHEPIKLPNEGV